MGPRPPGCDRLRLRRHAVFPAAALAVWLGGAALASVANGLVVIWGAVILIFLAGGRRGLSFRTPGGPRWSQPGMMLWLFPTGLVALVSTLQPALLLLLLGNLSLLVLDPVAARRDEAPLYVARLRPWQMTLPVESLLLLIGMALRK